MSNDNAPAPKPESKTAREKRVVAEWKGKLGSNPLWAVRGLLAVYSALLGRSLVGSKRWASSSSSS